MENYLTTLPEKISLAVFSDEKLIFTSQGKWLLPLFELETFLKQHSYDTSTLSLHDKIAGKAAAVLTFRLGIKKVNYDLISQPAILFFNSFGITPHYTNQTKKLLCQTEILLDGLTEIEDMYSILLNRVKLSLGVTVTANKLCVGFGKKIIINNLSFTVPCGGKLILEGENGCGKTTLLNTILGNKAPYAGTITIANKLPKDLEKRTIAYIKQNQNQENFPVSGLEVVKMGLSKGLKKNEANWETESAMKRTDCYDLRNRNYFTLSGGERQKITLARCLCQKAKLLLLDEPTSFLDKNSQDNLVQILREFETGQSPTIIVVTHDIQFLKQLDWPTLRMGGKIND